MVARYWLMRECEVAVTVGTSDSFSLFFFFFKNIFVNSEIMMEFNERCAA